MQVFPPITNVLSKISIVGQVVGLFILISGWGILSRSSYVTQAGVVIDQPIPFSHKHHTGELGIDCRFCHTPVEEGASAGMPATSTCMNCHSQIHADSLMLEPVRASYRENKPLRWKRVNDLPDFVYFNHSIHVARGVGCETCHGRVDQMPLTWQHSTLEMKWCLECHKDPSRFIRPRDAVFSFGWQSGEPQLLLGSHLANEYGVQFGDNKLTNCTICHR
jgi:hypothetical protein